MWWPASMYTFSCPTSRCQNMQKSSTPPAEHNVLAELITALFPSNSTMHQEPASQGNAATLPYSMSRSQHLGSFSSAILYTAGELMTVLHLRAVFLPVHVPGDAPV